MGVEKPVKSSLCGGWRDVGDGLFVSDIKNVPVTEEYKKFAEASRARWDLFEYLKVKFDQLRTDLRIKKTNFRVKK